jgi:uncharacterized protein (DUF2252 family)
MLNSHSPFSAARDEATTVKGGMSMSAMEIGREARQRVPRSSHADWKPSPDRTNPVEVLRAEDRTRVENLLPVRYERMLASAFTFYRGAAAIMAADLAAASDSGLRVQLCGDAHLSNFGIFRSAARRLVFDVDDFDETLPGPFEWDVKRLAASVAIAGRDRGFKRRERARAVLRSVAAYREAMAEFAAMREMEVWYSRLDVDEISRRVASEASAADRRRLGKNVARAQGRNSLRALSKLTEVRDGQVRIASRPPLLVPIEELAAAEGVDPDELSSVLVHLLARYRDTIDDSARALVERYRYVDAAHKVVGVGSVGTRAWIALLLGPGEDDPLFLQLKEAGPSVLEPFAGASEFDHHGRRVVVGQRLMQASGDVLLGWVTVDGFDGQRRDFYVRQLWDGKGSAEIETMNPKRMTIYAGLCGWTLARAHARTGDPTAITAYLGKSDRFDQAIGDYAELYADQNEADFEAVLTARRPGGR